LRRSVAVVMQDQFLFAGTIAGNIGLEDQAITPDRIRGAARAVRAEPFILALPRGYDDEVRERGSNFSVGQKQLLSFARVLAFDPAVLVLDEATASVDSETEMHIQTALRTVTAGRASLVIAHRLSTIRESDRILVLHRGGLREEGTHESLLARDGIYRMLHRLQFEPASGVPAMSGSDPAPGGDTPAA
jgi:ATP-binding cassette subfamily B protein